MKKVLGIVMALLLLAVSIVPVAVAADEEGVVITISKFETAAGEIVKAGDKFEITVSTNAIDAVGGFDLVLRYNKTLLKAAEPTLSGFLAEMDDCTVTTSEVGVFTEISIVSLYYLGDALTTEGGVIMTLAFEALKDITEDSRIFAVEDKCKAFASWMDSDSMPVTVEDGGVVITPAPEEEPPAEEPTPEEPEESAKISLLPAAADKFTCVAGGEGNVTVTAEGNGYKFVADKGWPSAYYAAEPADQVKVDTASDDAILYYDFTVVSGEANVYVFFAGINPGDKNLPEGSFVSLNKFIDQSKVNSESGDIAVGEYKGEVHVKDLGCAADYITDGKFVISGMKVFAVNGEVVMNELAVVGEKGVETDPETDPTTSTTEANATTTTVSKPDTAKQDSAKTGDVSNAVIFIIVAVVAAGLIAASVVLAKKKQEQ